MEQMPSQPPTFRPPTQEDVEAQIKRLRDAEANPSEAFLEIEGKLIAGEVDPHVPLDFDALAKQPRVFLASVSKIAIEELTAQILPLIGDVQANADTVLEHLGRDQADFRGKNPKLDLALRTALGEERYNRMLTPIERFYSEVDQLDLSDEEKTALKQEINDEIKSIKSEAHKFVEDELKQKPIILTPSELMYQVLTLSSNEATYLSGELLNEYFKDKGGVLEVIRILGERYFGYSRSILANFHHWVQESPNTGYYEPFAYKLHELVELWAHENASEGQKLLLEAILDNPSDFGHDQTTAYRNAGYLSKFWNFSKTGFYDSVFWPIDLAQQGFPTHMLMSEVNSVVDKVTKKVRTFWAYRVVRLPIPPKNLYVKSIGVTLLNMYDPEYAQMLAVRGAEELAKFRADNFAYQTARIGIEAPPEE